MTFIPIEVAPDTKACSSIEPEILVSRPIKTLLPAPKTTAQALPTESANSEVNFLLATPLMPSVPKNFPILLISFLINNDIYFYNIGINSRNSIW